MAHPQTKITVKVWKDLLRIFDQRLASCFIRRDAFLNHMISNQLPDLRQGVEGRKQSPEARRYISGELKRLDTTPINVVVDKEVASQLNAIVKEHNLVRDAFINRLMLLLSFPDQFLRALFGIDIAHDSIERLPDGFSDVISEIYDNPTYRMSASLEEWYGPDAHLGANIYTRPLDTTIIPDLNKKDGFPSGLMCYLEDVNVPNTEAWKKKRAELEEREFDLDSIDLDSLDRALDEARQAMGDK